MCAKKKETLEKEEKPSEEKGKGKLKFKFSLNFVMILAIVSIIGFIGIVSETLFNKNINIYVQAFWMIVVGIGMIGESRLNFLKKILEEGLTPDNFTHLITSSIGLITIIAGVLSFPIFNLTNPAFHAVRGIISIIAIIVIVIQTWLVDSIVSFK